MAQVLVVFHDCHEKRASLATLTWNIVPIGERPFNPRMIPLIQAWVV